MTFARTKIQPPRPRAAVVERASLRGRLLDALQAQRVVLLCAPGGYGKTTALVDALARRPERTALAWISSDPGDDLHRLLDCMVTALEPFDPPWRTAPESLVARAGEATAQARNAIAAEIINTLDACDVPHGVIVFDDLHRVNDAAFFEFLDLLIERLGERWTIAITSRTDPPLALARLRASDHLAEFRQLQLQFARDEARALAAGAGLDAASADLLFDRTQGWPAGMRLAIGAAKDVVSRRQGVDRPLFDFLVAEVQQQLRPELRDFLLHTCVLSELDAARCAAVSGNGRAGLLLDEIERLGLFVEVLDAPPASAGAATSGAVTSSHTLRLHDLFRAALQRQLELHQPALYAELRERAAATETDPLRRVTLLLEIGNQAEAARQIFAHGPRMIAEGALSTVSHLMRQFPGDFFATSPELQFVAGVVAWGHWDFAAKLGHMQRAEALYAQRGDRAGELFARAYKASAMVARGVLEEGGRQLSELRQMDLPATTRVIVLNGLSWHTLETGPLRAIGPLIDEMVTLLEGAGRFDLWYQTTPSTRVPGLVGVSRALHRQAEALLRVAGDHVTPLRALAMAMQTLNCFWQGRLDDAEELLARARDDAQWAGEPAPVRAYLLFCASLLNAVRGHRAAALEASLTRLREHQPGYGDWGVHRLMLIIGRIASACDDLPTLRTCLQRLDALRASFIASGMYAAGGDEAPFRQQIAVAAHIAWLEARPDEAIRLWRSALEHEDQVDILGQAADARVRLARALAQRGDVDDAARVLQPVFERADAEGVIGGALLATTALRDLADVDWGTRLPAAQQARLRAWWQVIGAGFPGPAGGAEQPAVPATVAVNPAARRATGTASRDTTAAPAASRTPTDGPLTAREMEVLQMIAAGDSNKLIARALDLSLHTVKRHVAHILGKLDLDSRGQAAAWFRAQSR